jgi:hypothetical protein
MANIMRSNRWFRTGNDNKVYFTFGKYRDQLLDEILSTKDGRWYIENVVMRFEDLPKHLHDYLEAALLYEHQGEGEAERAEPTISPTLRSQVEVAKLKAKLKTKLEEKTKAQKEAEERERVEKLQKKRQKDATW